MQISRSDLDPGLILFAILSLVSIGVLIARTPKPFVTRAAPFGELGILAVALLLGGAAAFAATGALVGALGATALAAGVCITVHAALPRLSAVGVLQMSLGPMSLVWLAPWTWLLLREQHYPTWALHAVAAGTGAAVLAAIYRFAVQLPDEAVFTHRSWRRLTAAPSGAIPFRAPKVSIHLPCYAEPPEVVIQTLDHLAALRYPDYEVIVCDNNTPDEALWRPLERHCRALSDRAGGAPFRFYHVAPIEGAKAGALNFCMDRTAPDAEIVALVDADYLAEPDFLSRLTGFFADDRVGFVQTPHDYRPDGSAYQAMAYWEYMPPNKLGLAGINEYDCAYTIGTMCLFRKDAIEAAGGWAEWCLTEDSEISIRIRALGYQGVYVNETFGRGLIPETYEDLKKQRFRWTAGPVQQLLAHWRLLLPALLGGRSRLHAWVKLMEANRSLAPLWATAGLAGGGLGLAAAFWLTVTDRLPPIQLPLAFWIAAVLSTAAGLGKLFQQYRLTGTSSPLAILGAEAARLSLGLVKITAALAAVSGRPLRWRRTPKFAARSCVLRCVTSTAGEIAVAAGFAALLYFPVRYQADVGPHAALLAALGCVAGALAFLTAPVMAVASELRLRALQAAEAPDRPFAAPLASALEPAEDYLSQVA